MFTSQTCIPSSSTQPNEKGIGRGLGRRLVVEKKTTKLRLTLQERVVTAAFRSQEAGPEDRYRGPGFTLLSTNCGRVQ